MKTITLDIETIVDLEACARAGVDPGEGFPAWPLHQIMCVSLLTDERVGRDGHRFSIETFSRVDHGERAIIVEVEHRLADAQHLITYNGRGFDLPVLRARAAVSGEAVPSIVRAGSRSNVGFHDDLLDAVTANGAAVRPKLVDLCAGLGIPAKLDMAGSSVAALAAAGQYDRIEAYCEGDVVSTYLAAQMWRSAEDPGVGIERWHALADWIRANQPRLAHLLAYCAVPDIHGGGRAFDPANVTRLRL